MGNGRLRKADRVAVAGKGNNKQIFNRNVSTRTMKRRAQGKIKGEQK